MSEQLDARTALNIARDLLICMRRAGTDSALPSRVKFRGHLDPAVHRVQNALSRDPTARWRLHDLSDVACTSEGNLSRLFARHARCSPLNVHLIRFAGADALVVQTRLALEQVAMRAGSHSARHLRRGDCTSAATTRGVA